MSLRIDRCYCFQQTFACLKDTAAATGADSVAALQAHVTFGQKCKLCHPYARRMLQTGETVFHEIIRDGGPQSDGTQSDGTQEPTTAEAAKAVAR
ncbi:MAG: (2Fe-2S)-binding protein [Bacteroidota bacterium]